MSKKYILAFVVIVAVALSISIWALSPSPTSSPPQSNNATQHTDPDWTFPPESEPAIPLPDFRPVVTEVMPSVVSVITEVVTSDFFGRQYTESVAGSGIVIDDKGYIATNNHVVEDGQSIYVELADGRVKCSLRSRGAIDVRQIAQKFGGGGHAMAAGTHLPGPLENAKQLILEQIAEQFAEIDSK